MSVGLIYMHLFFLSCIGASSASDMYHGIMNGVLCIVMYKILLRVMDTNADVTVANYVMHTKVCYEKCRFYK